MGETRVDLQHLLEDLRDAYPGALEETILTEVIANALDSGASRIELSTDAAQGRFIVVDNGDGMSRSVLRRYHDIAASTKTRGEGIGFAGVGIKLGLLLSDEVVTETRRGATHVATSWRLAARKRAPWRWIEPPGLVSERGTAVRLSLQNRLSPLLDAGYLMAAVQRHFAPLLDPAFAEFLTIRYPQGVALHVNGAPVVAPVDGIAREPVALRVGRRRKPGAVGFLARAAEPLPEDRRGVAVSSLGKVIKQGWDWLGLNPADGANIGGLVEVPALAECLTLNKADFIRSGARGATYLLYRRALQQAVTAQLAAWGTATEEPEDARLRRRARPVERDLQTVLVDLAEEFPLLASLVERHAGGQRALPVGKTGAGPGMAAAAMPEPLPQEELPGALASETPPPQPPPADAPHVEPPTVPPAPGPQRGRRRPVRYGLTIQFESRPGDPSLGRLAESTVWINEAHPAYRRAVASRSEGYHLALAVALALAPLTVEPAQLPSFLMAFLTHWGEAVDGSRRRRAK